MLADENGLKSIAIPAISTGIFGFPIERAARVILGAVKEYIESNPETTIKLVLLCLYGENDYSVFVSAFDEVLS